MAFFPQQSYKQAHIWHWIYWISVRMHKSNRGELGNDQHHVTMSLSMILVVVLNGTPIWNHGQLFSVNEPWCHSKSVSKSSSKATSPTTQSPKHIPKYSAKWSKKNDNLQNPDWYPSTPEMGNFQIHANSNHTSPSTSHIFIPWFSTCLSWQNHILTTPNDRRSKKNRVA